MRHLFYVQFLHALSLSVKLLQVNNFFTALYCICKTVTVAFAVLLFHQIYN